MPEDEHTCKYMEDNTKVTIRLPASMVEEAKQYDINVSKAARKGIQTEIDRQKRITELGL